MDSDLIYPTSSPAAVDNLKIPFSKTFQSFEVNDTDDDVSPNERDENTFKELPPALWAPSNNTQGRSVIRIPPQHSPFHTPIKRKHNNQSPDPYCSTLSISPAPAKKWRPKAFNEDPSSEPEVFIQSSKGKLKHRPKLSELPGVSPKHCGRPHKIPVDPQSCDFSAHVYIEIANPPKLHRGKTHKTDKYVSQGPTTEGPFTFTHHMGWKSFLSQVAELAELEKGNIALTQMTWRFQGKTKSLPLGGEGGFTAMVMQIRVLKVGVSAIIMLGLPVPPPKPSRGGRNAPAVTSEDEYAAGLDAGEATQTWGKKLSLDDQLGPIIEKLHSMYKIGACSEHPDIRCFRWVANNWHFDIDNTRTKVWANAILRKVTDYNQVPLASNYFGAKHRLGFSNSKYKPASVAVADVSAGSTTPSLWDSHPYYSPLPNHPQYHYGHPYQQYGNLFPPGFASQPLLNATVTPYPGQAPPQVQPGQGNQTVAPEQLTPTLSVSQAAVKAFCDKYDLGDEEREGLHKLGFRIGDDLNTVTESEWAVSGLAPLHRRRVLSAWNTEQSA